MCTLGRSRHICELQTAPTNSDFPSFTGNLNYMVVLIHVLLLHVMLLHELQYLYAAIWIQKTCSRKLLGR